MEPASIDAIEPPANALFVDDGTADPEACHELCRTGAETAFLSVSYPETPAPRPAGDPPAKLGIVSVGESLPAVRTNTGPSFVGSVPVDVITDPTDLPAIGVSVSHFCAAWADEPERITVCLRSADAMIRRTDPEAVFRFLHVLTARLSGVDALAHVHLDPTGLDDRIVATLGTLFDKVVDESNSLPEATDAEVAAVLEEWGLQANNPAPDPTPTAEATDDEIARRLEECV